MLLRRRWRRRRRLQPLLLLLLLLLLQEVDPSNDNETSLTLCPGAALLPLLQLLLLLLLLRGMVRLCLCLSLGADGKQGVCVCLRHGYCLRSARLSWWWHGGVDVNETFY